MINTNIISKILYDYDEWNNHQNEMNEKSDIFKPYREYEKNYNSKEEYETFINYYKHIKSFKSPMEIQQKIREYISQHTPYINRLIQSEVNNDIELNKDIRKQIDDKVIKSLDKAFKSLKLN